MRNRRRDHQQQAGGGRQRGRDAARGYQRNDPVGQIRDFRIGQNHDVRVDLQFVTLPAIGLGLSCKVRIGIVVILNPAVAVVVCKGQQTGLFPGAKPGRTLRINQVAISRSDFAGLQGVDQVQPGHGANSGRSGVQNRDEQQCVAG